METQREKIVEIKEIKDRQRARDRDKEMVWTRTRGMEKSDW